MVVVGILGAGRIGRAIRKYLLKSKSVELRTAEVVYADQTPTAPDVERVVVPGPDLEQWISRHAIDYLFDCLPGDGAVPKSQDVFRVANGKVKAVINMTERLDALDEFESESETHPSETAIIPAVGLAPGIAGRILHEMLSTGPGAVRGRIYVGAIPVMQVNDLGWQAVWSPAGLVEEYLGHAEMLRDGVLARLPALTEIDKFLWHRESQPMEAFLTVGGLGTLARTWHGKVENVEYKTLRWKGHVDFLKTLLFDLNLSERENRHLLIAIMEKQLNRIPNAVFIKIDAKWPNRSTLFETIIFDEPEGPAIQRTTASGAVAALEAYLVSGRKGGFIKIEDLPWTGFCDSVAASVYDLPDTFDQMNLLENDHRHRLLSRWHKEIEIAKANILHFDRH